MTPYRRLRRVLGRGRRGSTGQSAAGSSGRPPEPLLSVVVPVYNTEQFLGRALESVLDQSYARLEVIVVDDGSPDDARSLALTFAERDPRVKVVSQPNAGLGAARNTGVRHATGDFLTFLDSDDLLLSGAYRAMMTSLLRSGSDFVTGTVVRGDESHSKRPAWMARTMSHDRSGLRIDEHPDMLLDITCWNKVFRRAFWDGTGLAFPEGVRYEDQAPMTRAFLAASSFDVLRRSVYLWRTRQDGTSISQQKASLADLRDRITSQLDCHDLIEEHASDPVRDAWYRKLLVHDLPAYSQVALDASDEYWHILWKRLADIRADIPSHVWGTVPFYPRVMSWVISHGDREAADALSTYVTRHPRGLPLTTQAGRPCFAPDLDETHLRGVPSHLLHVEDTDVEMVARLMSISWEGDDLVLRGVAFPTNIPPTPDAPLELTAVLVDRRSGETVSLDVERFADDRCDQLSRRDFEDHNGDGVLVRIPARLFTGRVADAAETVDLRWSIRLEHRCGDLSASGAFTEAEPAARAWLRRPHVVGDRLVSVTGNVAAGLELQVRRRYAVLTSVEPQGDSAALVIQASPDDPVMGLELRDGDRRTPLAAAPRDGGTGVVVRPGQDRAVLWAVHESGTSEKVRWGAPDPAYGADAEGTFVRSGDRGSVVVGETVPTVLVDEVDPTGSGLVVRGTYLGRTPARLALVGPRATSAASSLVHPGDFEVVVPTHVDPWGLGAADLPEDRYRLESASGSGVLVLGSDAMRHRPEARYDGGSGNHWGCGLAGDGSVLCRAAALPSSSRAHRAQQQLRDGVYGVARSQDTVPVVLFESFGGRTLGDSPRAIAQALARRGNGLDLVFSVADHSLPELEGTRQVIRGSREWHELLGRARYLVNNAHFPDFFSKAPGQVYLQTWHGTPLKRIGRDLPNYQFVSRNYMKTMDAEAATWDFLLSPSPYCTDIFPRAFGYEGRVLELGYPRNDILCSERAEQVRRAVRQRLGIEPHQRVVLYAPTWRETARTRNQFSKVLYLDADELARRSPDTVVLVRGHANTAASPSVPAHDSGRVRDVTLYPDINDLFLAADILVTDYSSVMFDFALLDRPMYFLTPDLEGYRSKLRGFYFDFESEAPGPLLDDAADLVDLLAGSPPDEHAKARASFRERFSPWDDGHAADRVVDVVFGEDV